MTNLENNTMMGEIVEVKVELQTPSRPVNEDTIFVALGKDLKESETFLYWALCNSRGKKICILHIHQPAQKIPMMGSKVSISLLDEYKVKAYHENERREMQDLLDKYIRTCNRAGMQASELHKEMKSVAEGIVQFVSELNIKWLVMGTAASKSYSRGKETTFKQIFSLRNSTRKVVELKSKKAIYVCQEAPSFCHIWFIHKGHLIHTRESKVDGVDMEREYASLLASPNAETLQSSLRSLSLTEGQNGRSNLTSSVRNYRRAMSDNDGMRFFGPSDSTGGETPLSVFNPEGNTDSNSPSWRSPSIGAQFSTCPSREIIESSASTSPARTVGSEILLDFPMLEHNVLGDHRHSPIAARASEGTVNAELHHRLLQFVAEVESFKRDTHEESIRRKKAEEQITDAIDKAKASATMYTELLRHRKEIEESLSRGKEEVEKMRYQLVAVIDELRCEIDNSDKMVEELEQKMFSAVELLQRM